MRKVSKVNLVSDDEFISIIKNNETYTAVLKEIGLSTTGGSSLKVLKKRIEKMGLSTEHFKPKYANAIKHNTIKDEDVFIEHSTYASNSALKRKIIKYKILPYKCSKCGNTGKWNGQALILQIDHINGINDDNRLENLRFLCPNCHSQTNTYAGKNKKRIKRDKKKFICKDCGKKYRVEQLDVESVPILIGEKLRDLQKKN